MKEFTEAPAPPAPEPTAENNEPTPTLMALAFEAAIKDNDNAKKQRDIEKLIANSLKR
jgi:hypothetical protein